MITADELGLDDDFQIALIPVTKKAEAGDVYQEDEGASDEDDDRKDA